MCPTFGVQFIGRHFFWDKHGALFAVMFDELVGPDDLVRVIDAWISSLDLKALGFSKAQTQVMGRPP